MTTPGLDIVGPLLLTITIALTIVLGYILDPNLRSKGKMTWRRHIALSGMAVSLLLLFLFIIITTYI